MPAATQAATRVDLPAPERAREDRRAGASDDPACTSR